MGSDDGVNYRAVQWSWYSGHGCSGQGHKSVNQVYEK
jgi:hypothetical protein